MRLHSAISALRRRCCECLYGSGSTPSAVCFEQCATGKEELHILGRNCSTRKGKKSFRGMTLLDDATIRSVILYLSRCYAIISAVIITLARVIRYVPANSCEDSLARSQGKAKCSYVFMCGIHQALRDF